MVCNNLFTNIKLSSLKVDTKYIHHQHPDCHIVKLTGGHSISSGLETINIYYNNRTVQAVVELKNKPTMWHLAMKITLSSRQMDLKIEFSLPILACNITIKYSDFYENIQVCGLIMLI